MMHPDLLVFMVTIVRFEVFKAASGMLCRVALVRTNVSEELSASIIMVTRIGFFVA
jgi:hypothetical protein